MIELRLLALSITFRRLIFQWCWHRLPGQIDLDMDDGSENSIDW